MMKHHRRWHAQRRALDAEHEAFSDGFETGRAHPEAMPAVPERYTLPVNATRMVEAWRRGWAHGRQRAEQEAEMRQRMAADRAERKRAREESQARLRAALAATRTQPTPEPSDTKRWTGTLAELGATLRAEVTGERWVWRRLRGGALVACRHDPITKRLQFRVAREQRPSLAERPRFVREAEVFAHHLGCSGWPLDIRDTGTQSAGGIEAVWTAPFESEAGP